MEDAPGMKTIGLSDSDRGVMFFFGLLVCLSVCLMNIHTGNVVQFYDNFGHTLF